MVLGIAQDAGDPQSGCRRDCGRNMSEIPRPFVIDSLKRWARLPSTVRARVRFLHMNHTNPLLDPGSDAWRVVHEAGFRVARQGEWVDL